MKDVYEPKGSYNMYGTYLVGLEAGKLFTLTHPYGIATENHIDKKPPIYMVLAPEAETKTVLIYNTESMETESVHESSQIFPFTPDKEDENYKELLGLTIPFTL